MYLKAQGKRVKDHPVIQQLLKLKNCIDRLQPSVAQLDEKIDAMLANGKLVSCFFVTILIILFFNIVDGGEEDNEEDEEGEEVEGDELEGEEDEDEELAGKPQKRKRSQAIEEEEEESSESELDETLFPRLEEEEDTKKKRRKLNPNEQKLMGLHDFLDAVEEEAGPKATKKQPIGSVVSDAVQHLNNQPAMSADNDLLDRDMAGKKKFAPYQPQHQQRSQTIYDKKGRKKKQRPFQLKEGKGRRTARLGKGGRMKY